MKTQILMVYPEFPATYWSLKHALKFVNKKSAIIPLGLLTVAALLPEEYSVTLIDMNVQKLTEDDIKKSDMVFISAMIVQKPSFDKVVTMCNRLSVPVVAGGPYPTSSYQKISGVDHFVLNEAEITLPRFIRDYGQGTLKHLYIDAEKPDITKTPLPRFDLVDFRNYNNIALQNSRGCPFNCEFCDIIELFGRIPRFKEPGQFVHEMDMVYRRGFRGSLFVVDDNFIGNKKKVKELLHEITGWQMKNNYPFSLFTEASINLADDDELLQLMVEAGFDMVFVGIETPDSDALKSCDKNQNLNRSLYDSIKKIQNAGIEVAGGFIVGFDEDTEDIFDRQIEFIQKAGIPMAMVGILGALPNTRLYRRLEKEGRIKPGKNFTGNNTHNLHMSFIPSMPEKKIIEGYKKIISEIYSPDKYFKRCYTLLEELPAGTAKSPRHIGLVSIRALLRSLIKQVFSPYPLHYIKFLLKVIIHKARHFPLAVEHAIKGYHFFIITRDILKADELYMELSSAKKMARTALESLTSGTEAPAQVVACYSKSLIHYMKKIERKYSRSGRDVQVYLYEQYHSCKKIFSTCMSRIREFYKYSDTL